MSGSQKSYSIKQCHVLPRGMRKLSCQIRHLVLRRSLESNLDPKRKKSSQSREQKSLLSIRCSPQEGDQNHSLIRHHGCSLQTIPLEEELCSLPDRRVNLVLKGKAWKWNDIFRLGIGLGVAITRTHA